MADHYTIRCETCEVDGPYMRRAAGGVFMVDPADMLSADAGRSAWERFMIEHDCHDLRLPKTY